MRSAILVFTAALFGLVTPGRACDECKKAAQPMVLIAGLGQHHHPVSTESDEAQRFFDQGMKLIFAFNHDEAVRAFRRAAELDPKLAMAHWGIAYSLGPNINMEVDFEREKQAFDAAQQAQKLAADAPENERAYTTALVKRYSDDPQADLKQHAADFAAAMGRLAAAYPDDLDAATLYAESLMNLRPWQLYSRGGEPAEGTDKIVATLESVLARHPEHPGANHYYIHAVEASTTPERALPSAARLARLAPLAGHLIHMPAHVYVRTGDYEAAAASNLAAIEADREYFKLRGAAGMYAAMYYSHNWHFLAVARAYQQRWDEAICAANELVKHVGPHVAEMPPVEVFMPTPLYILVGSERWDDVLALAAPAEAMPTTRALWHFARGAAFAAKGQVDEALGEQERFAAAAKLADPKLLWGLNTPETVLAVAAKHLEARIALARDGRAAGVKLLREAVELEDALNYAEPPDWYLFARQTLGRLLLEENQPAEAEAVFRAQLKILRRDPPALAGLIQSLEAQGKTSAVPWLKQEYRRAMKINGPR